jgi:transcriptional antiterminator RfaH
MGWAVLLTQPNRERTAEEHARDQGFEVWFPRVSKNELLFPRYGFVNVIKEWYALLGTRGVSDVLRSGERPMYVPETSRDPNQITMASLRVRERGGFVVLPPRHRFAPGEPVRVDEGPFYGEQGMYQGMPREGRAEVLLSMLGRVVPVTLDEAALIAA